MSKTSTYIIWQNTIQPTIPSFPRHNYSEKNTDVRGKKKPRSVLRYYSFWKGQSPIPGIVPYSDVRTRLGVNLTPTEEPSFYTFIFFNTYNWVWIFKLKYQSSSIFLTIHFIGTLYEHTGVEETEASSEFHVNSLTNHTSSSCCSKALSLIKVPLFSGCVHSSEEHAGLTQLQENTVLHWLL